jgi:hypothetical protein
MALIRDNSSMAIGTLAEEATNVQEGFPTFLTLRTPPMSLRTAHGEATDVATKEAVGIAAMDVVGIVDMDEVAGIDDTEEAMAMDIVVADMMVVDITVWKITTTLKSRSKQNWHILLGVLPRLGIAL